MALWDWPRGLEVFLFSFSVGFLWHVSTSLTYPELPIDGFCLLSAPPGGAAGPACPTAACCWTHCACRVQRLYWVMIPNQNNYNNCLCEENQIKGFRTLGRDHTSRMFSSGSWKRLGCFLCSSLRGGGRAVLCLSLSPSPLCLGVFREGDGPSPRSHTHSLLSREQGEDFLRCFIYL